MVKKNRLLGMTLYGAAMMYAGAQLDAPLAELEARVRYWDIPLAEETHPRVHRLERKYVIEDGRRVSVLYDPVEDRTMTLQDDLYPPQGEMLEKTWDRLVEHTKEVPDVVKQGFSSLAGYVGGLYGR